ncbi:MAG: hypothetical protein RBR43_02875 [Desulfuromonadaceae bacterium]|nr:hypothetical protein [Desulfuromonas sp.]MDY0184807.1 hypothetical protein [Desulfuromonadaceae bacterium]
MPKPDTPLWHNITLLFLSKFITSTTQTFAKKELINPKNIGLAGKFAAMLGSEVDDTEVRKCLNKAVKELEREGVLHHMSTGEMHLSTAGIARMNAERSRAMAQIATNFPGSTPQGKTAADAGSDSKLN